MKKEIYLILIAGILGISFLGSILAEEGCCLRTTDGRYNKFVDETLCNVSDLNEGYFQVGVSCDDAIFVDSNGNILNEKGCCIDYNNPQCTDGIYRAECEDADLIFESSSTESCNAISLNPNPCTESCCVVSGIGYYETSMECDARSNLIDEPDFLDLSYSECNALAYSNATGACINSGKCENTIQNACSGTFEIGIFCSDEYIKETYGISCNAKSYTSCSENPDDSDVYYYDSCRNMEGVADECSSGETKCGLENGEYTCTSVSCDYNNGTLLNGESQCIYDSPVGEGNDFVGSVHGTVTCFEGELYYENCNGEAREQICEEIITKDTGFTRAICVTNLAENCLALNLEYFEKINRGELEYEEGIAELSSTCYEMSQCVFMNESIGNYFEYDFCVPKDTGTIEIDNDTTSCDIATSTCTVYFQRNLARRFECVANCECLKTESFEKMNSLCNSMGDCGMEINVKGDLGEDGLVFEPEWDAGLSSRFSNDAVEDYEAIVNKRNLNVAKTVVLIAEETIKNKWVFDLYETFKKNGVEESLQIEFPDELMEEILGEDYNSLTESERQERIIEYYANQGIELSEIGLLEQVGWDYELSNSEIADGLIISYPKIIFEISTGIFWPINLLRITITIFGVGDIETIDVTYTCEEWQASAGVSNSICALCNEGNLSCTKYKCKSLGQNCILANEDSTNPLCVSDNDNGNSPIIESIKSLDEENYFIDEVVNNKKWKLYSQTDSDSIAENTEINFVLKTDEVAQCKYSFQSYSTYSDMPSNYPTSTDYLYEHEFKINSGNVLSFIDEEKYNEYILCIEDNGTETYCLENAGIENVEVSLKIRCQDIFGHFSEEVELNYSIDVRPDEDKPQVLSFSPASGTEFEYNPGSFDLILYLNENAECKYEFDNSINFEDLHYNMTALGKSGSSGWLFSAIISEIYLGNNEIYIKCKDYSENENINENIKYEFTLKRDIPEEEYIDDYGLEIGSIYVENNVNGEESYDGENLTTSIKPSLSLKVKTAKGVDSGVATCYLNSGKTILMSGTDSNEHSQVYSGLSEGTKEFFVLCEDGISEVNETISIDLIIDDEKPTAEITAGGDYLTVVTNEDAYCTYSNEDCDFDIDEGKTFYEKNYVIEHNTGWNSGLSYFVRCVDEFSNEGCVGSFGGETEGPVITRIIYSGNKVTIQTDRTATCYYSVEECGFEVTDSETNEMNSASEIEHYFILGDETRYYIKCEDPYGNVNSDCTRINVY